MGKPSDVYWEWEAIAFPDGRYAGGPEHDDTQWTQYLALDALCFRDGEWRVPIDDAFLVATMGMSTGVVTDRYEEAVAIGERFFAHPEIASLSDHDREEVLFWHGCAQLGAGRIEAGCALLRRILEREGYGRSSRAREVVSAVVGYAEKMAPSMAPPEAVRELAADALGFLPGTVRRRRAVLRASTMGELFGLLYG